MVESRTDAMSTATSLANPLIRPITLCPYCDHVSPEGSKFCGACGAALHLMPCPHCGAVNDITVVTACYRCHGDLHENATIVLPPPAPAKPVEAESEEGMTPYVTLDAATRQRPHALVVGIILLAFAAASYYAYRQRTVIGARESAQSDSKDRGGSDTGANTGTGTIIKVPTVVNNSVAVPVDPKGTKADGDPPRETSASTAAAGQLNAGKPNGDRATIASPAAKGEVAPDIARARIDASKGIEKRKLLNGPCTEAVAALGLCTPESNPGRP